LPGSRGNSREGTRDLLQIGGPHTLQPQPIDCG
jgi:hypothetical protein